MKKQYTSLLLLLTVPFIAHAGHRNLFSIFDDMHRSFDAFSQQIPMHRSTHIASDNINITEGNQLSIAIALTLQENDFNQIKSSVNAKDKEVLVKTPRGTITVALQQNKHGAHFVTASLTSQSQKETKDAHGYSSQSSAISSRESKNLHGTPLFTTKEDVSVIYKKDEQKLYITIPMQMPEKQTEEQNPNYEEIQVLIK